MNSNGPSKGDKYGIRFMASSQKGATKMEYPITTAAPTTGDAAGGVIDATAPRAFQSGGERTTNNRRIAA